MTRIESIYDQIESQKSAECWRSGWDEFWIYKNFLMVACTFKRPNDPVMTGQ